MSTTIQNLRQCLEQAISIAREISLAEVEGEGELTLGQLELKSGHMERAVARFERSEEICIEAEDKRGQAAAMWWLGKVDLGNREIDRARLRLSGALIAFHVFEMNPR